MDRCAEVEQALTITSLELLLAVLSSVQSGCLADVSLLFKVTQVLRCQPTKQSREDILTKILLAVTEVKQTAGFAYDRGNELDQGMHFGVHGFLGPL
jgi:hypothetical protein